MPGRTFTKAELGLCRGAQAPDLVGHGCKLLFVGINPGLWTAMTGWHFAHPSNRFYPALRAAGVIDFLPDIAPTTPAVRLPDRGRVSDRPEAAAGAAGRLPTRRGAGLDAGPAEAQRRSLLDAGIGLTNLVGRATARAAELSAAELAEGAACLTDLVDRIAPSVVAVAGVTAYRVAFGRPRASLGRQPEGLAGSALWVVPNPSGLNAHETIDTLASWYREAADAAGLG